MRFLRELIPLVNLKNNEKEDQKLILRANQVASADPLNSLIITFGDLSPLKSLNYFRRFLKQKRRRDRLNKSGLWTENGTSSTPPHIRQKSVKNRKSPWIDKEIATLVKHYPRGEKRELIAKLNRTWEGIKRKARRLGLKFSRAKHDISKEELEKIYKLEGYRQTAEHLGVSTSTVYNWLKKNGISPLRKASKPNLSLSTDLLYILGVLRGDGFTIRKNRYTAGLVTVSAKFAISFADALRNIGLHPQFYSYTLSYRSKKRRAYRVVVSSKIFVEWYRDLNDGDIKKMIGEDRKLAAAFVRGFFESEGSFYLIKDKYPAIEIGNANFQLMTMVRDLISLLGVSMNFWSGEKAGKERQFYRLHKAGKTVLDLINTIKPCIKASPSNLNNPKDSRGRC